MAEAEDKFVHYQNVDNYRRQLRDPLLTTEQRTTITRLLTEATIRGDGAGWLPSAD